MSPGKPFRFLIGRGTQDQDVIISQGFVFCIDAAPETPAPETPARTVADKLLAILGGSGLRLSIGMKRQDIAHGTVERGWYAYYLAEFDDSSAEPINFQSVAAFQIMVHRGNHLRWKFVAEGEAILGILGTQRHSVRLANSNDFSHDIQQEPSCPGICTNGAYG